ncbi:hypothetical protein M406DRAFT_45958, partial [Cryphonectria parasitica EP155]
EHFEVLSLRHTIPLNPDAVGEVTCWDPEAHIVYHDQNAAQLAICDGISGPAHTRCRASSPVTVGKRGSAQFTLTTLRPGTTIDISKVRWEECVRAARDKCPTGSLSGVCLGGASWGDIGFVLESTLYAMDL